MRRALAVATLAALALLLLGGAAAPRRTGKAPARARAATTKDSARAAARESLVYDSLGPSQLYLSWRAPYGMPGASDTMTFDPADSTRVDTLFLSFETGADGPDFLGMMARLYFHPAPGESLGRYWRFNQRDWNALGLAVEFDPDGTFPCPQPWVVNGMGYPSYEFDAAGSKFDLYYVMQRLQDANAVSARTRYCFGRLLFRQKHVRRLDGATQPVCIEWAEAKYHLNGRDRIARLGPQRFVSVNSPDGRVTLPYRRAVRPAPWVPAQNRSLPPRQPPAPPRDSAAAAPPGASTGAPPGR